MNRIEELASKILRKKRGQLVKGDGIVAGKTNKQIIDLRGENDFYHLYHLDLIQEYLAVRPYIEEHYPILGKQMYEVGLAFTFHKLITSYRQEKERRI